MVVGGGCMDETLADVAIDVTVVDVDDVAAIVHDIECGVTGT